jgi:integrase
MLPADEFGPLKLKEVQQDIATQKRSRYYVNSVTSRIKRAFKWAASEELINPSTYHALLTVQGIQRGRTNAKESSPVQPVAWQHVEPVLAELSPVLAAMVRLQWFTAARSGSLVQAHVEQFDCKASPWVWKPRHKTEYRGHDLALFIGPQAQAAITPYMGSGYLFRPQEHAKNRRFGKHYTSGSYRQAIDRAIDRVNQERAKSKQDAIPAWTPHQLRHSRATAVRASHGLEAAQAVLGHENLETTQIYAERNLLLARQIALQSG